MQPLPEVPRLFEVAHRGISHAADAQPHFRQLHRQLGILSKATGAFLRLHLVLRAWLLDVPRATPPGTCKIEPYCGYETYNFKAIVPLFPEKARRRARRPWHRFYVRCLSRGKREAGGAGLRRYPTAAGLAPIEAPRHLPAGEARRDRGPRGQMGFYVVGRNTADPVPFRVRARSSCFCNLSVTTKSAPAASSPISRPSSAASDFVMGRGGSVGCPNRSRRITGQDPTVSAQRPHTAKLLRRARNRQCTTPLSHRERRPRTPSRRSLPSPTIPISDADGTDSILGGLKAGPLEAEGKDSLQGTILHPGLDVAISMLCPANISPFGNQQLNKHNCANDRTINDVR